MVGELGDGSKCLKNNKSRANLLGRGGRKKSMFFKDQKPLLLAATLSESLKMDGNGGGMDLK